MKSRKSGKIAGAGRNGAASKKPKPPKAGTGAKLALAAVTAVNLGLTLALHVLRRQEVLHAVETDEDVKLLLTRREKTEPLEGSK